MSISDIVGIAVIALFIALGVCGFIFGLCNFTTLEKLCKRIEKLEDRVSVLYLAGRIRTGNFKILTQLIEYTF